MKQIIKTLIISLINICLISAGYALPEDNNTSIDNEKNAFVYGDKSFNNITNLYYVVKSVDNNKQSNHETEDCYLEADNCQYHIKKRRS